MASQLRGGFLDRQSPLDSRRIGTECAGALTLRSTENIAPDERLDYWRSAVLHRVVPISLSDGPEQFTGRLLHIAGDGCSFVDHASEAMHTRRDPRQLRRDGCDDISICLLGPGGRSQLSHAGSHLLGADDLCVADFSKPIDHLQARNRDITLLFQRKTLEDNLKGDVSTLAGRLLPRHGIAALLRSHMRLLASEAEHLTMAERAVAVRAAAEMALMALQAELAPATELERFPAGLYLAAIMRIREECWDPDFNPAAVARNLGCSRATLYRLFAAEATSVAREIWNARLDRANQMLGAPAHAEANISDIAFRSGFIDMPTFSRMYKRRFDRTPTEARRAMI